MLHEYRYLKVDQFHVRYLEVRDERTVTSVVFIHGLGGSIESWVKTIELLSSSQLNLIAFDLPGFGDSSKPKTNYTIAFYTKFVTKLIKKLNLGSSIFLVGSSLGGQIAAEVTISHPRLVSKLVLISPAGISPSSFKLTSALKGYTSILKAKSIPDVKNALAQLDRIQVDEEYANTVLSRLSVASAKEAFLSALRGSTNAPRFTRKLDKIHSDTLVIWGKDDQIIPVKYSIPFVKMRNCRLVLLEKCGHRPHMERPELFTNLLIDFFENK